MSVFNSYIYIFSDYKLIKKLESAVYKGVWCADI